MTSTAGTPPAQGGSFQSTRWTLVLSAGETAAERSQAHRALSELCRIYWRPLYLFLRREGFNSDDAQDLTQGFFAELIRDRTYRRADREKGRFRSFLIGTLRHFVADIRDREQAQRRGGGKVRELFDEETIAEVEAQFARSKDWNSSVLLDREWAAALLRQTFDRLKEECELMGKAPLYAALQPHLASVADAAVPYEELSKVLRRGVTTLRSDVARLRARYRAILREEVRGTVSAPEEVEEELRYLRQVITQA